MTFLKHLLVALAVVFTAACSSNPNAIEPTELTRFAKEYKVKKVWRRGAGEGLDEQALWFRPALSGDRIYAADVDGRVYAFSTDRGKRQWKVKLKEPLTAAAAAGYGLVVVGTRGAELVALSADDGAERWRTQLSSEILAPPALGEGYVVVQTLDGRLSALDVDSGEVRWTYEVVVPILSLRGTSTPLIEDGRVYAAFASGKVVAVELASGVPIWERRVAEPSGRSELDRLVDIDGNLFSEGGGLFAATYQGKLAVLDQQTGRPFWDKDMSVFRQMASDNGVVFISDDVGRVWAIDQRSGSALWKQEGLYGRGSIGVVVQNGVPAAADSDGYLHWFAPEDGRFVARRRVDRDGFAGAPVERAGIVYTLSADGKLAAWRLVPR